VPSSQNKSATPEDPFTGEAPPSVSRAVRRTLRRLKREVGNRESLLWLYLRATPLGTERKLTDQTRLCIEGSPRSGNTFACRAMEQASPEPILISSHVHVPAGVMRAVHLNYPTLVLIRQPIDSICSEKIAAPHATLRSVLDDWVNYYRKIWPSRDGYTVATFEEVIADFGAVTARLNERFGTSFAEFEPSHENIEAVFAAIERKHLQVHGDTEHSVPRPSTSRRSAKDVLAAQLEGLGYRERLEEAHSLYRDYSRLAGVSPPRPRGSSA
jgi:hypothetical protein